MGTTDQPRATTSGETQEQLRRLQKRLSRALNALADGDEDAVDDIAAALRTLVGRGRGDDLIRRVRKAFGLQWPLLFVGPAASDATDVTLSAGSIPSRVKEPPGDCAWIRVDQWADSLAVVINQGRGQRKANWQKLIEAYANTYGSHASNSIPSMLDETSRMHADQMNLGQYMIHCAGLGVADAITQMIDEIDGKTVVRGQLLQNRLTPLYGLIVGRQSMEGAKIFIDDRDISERTHVIKMHLYPHQWQRVFVEPLPGGAGKNIALDLHDAGKPDWWPE
ncbi:hypothetical protein [Mycobacterium riyadhense]|uniref:hypothetical protein n=1 Tax=Mycobacterium riyadhense TaxID=486698 RepID=UPI00195BE958|nr:hypothetical protein [Mycobacterium riyadhense]